jgi:glycerol-3-phosphate O-acyltransferase / dihydroxyacetone phosphate acyltransferase
MTVRPSFSRSLRRLADDTMRGLALVLVRIFFRRVETEHGERLPEHGPVLVVANHTNGLVDGLLLMATLRRYPRFLGKSTLFKIPPLWPFLKLAGVIPVYRAADGGPTERNASAFATSDRLLARQGVVAIFPEGISHDESALQPLRTGAARIALEAAIGSDVPDVAIAAVGLLYDDKATFRSRALVRIGEPSDVSPWGELYRQDGREAVRQLTDAVARQLREVSPPYASWAQADELARIAEVVVRTPDERLPGDVDLAERAAVADRLASAAQRIDLGPRFDGLRAGYAAYEQDLHLLGLTDAQVASRYTRRTLRGSVAWSLAKVAVATPFALIGIIVHVIPFQIVKQLAKRPRNEGIKATVKLLGCFTLFLLTYTVIGFLVGTHWGAWLGLVAAVVAPLCGYLAVRLFERVKRVGGLLEGYRTMRGRKDVLESVFAHRRRVVASARALLEQA